MSNKNKISILFEALGIDKIIKSLKDLVSDFAHFEKGANKASSASDDFGDDLSKMAKESGKAESALKGMGSSLENSQRALTVTDKAVIDNNKSLSQFKTEMENANKARNEAVAAAVNESKNVRDVIEANNKYKTELEGIQKGYGGAIGGTKEYRDLQKELSNSITATADANKELNDIVGKGNVSFESVSKTLAKQQNTMKQGIGVSKSLKTAFDALNASLSGIMLVLSVVGKAKNIIGGVIDKGKEYSDALNIQVEAENKMAIALSKNSKLTDGSAKAFTNFAGEIQKTTAYTDEFVMGLVQIGAQGGHSEEEIKRLTQVSLDLASAAGTDATSAMKALSAGMNDAGKIMSQAEQAGKGFTNEEKKMIAELQNAGKQAEASAFALSKIQAAVGGSAQKETETFAGKQKQLQNAMGGVKEEFGRMAQALAKPFLDKQTEMVRKFFDLLKNPKIVEPIQKVITGFKVAGDVIGALAAIWIERFKAVISVLTIVPRAFFNIAQGLFGMASNTEEGMNSFTNIIAGAVGYVQNFGDIVTQIFQTISQTVGDFMQVIEAAASFNFKKAKESLITFKDNAAQNLKEIGSSVGDLFDPSKMAEKGKQYFEKVNGMYGDTKKFWEQLELDGQNVADSAENNKQGKTQETLQMKLKSLQDAHAFESQYAVMTTADEKKQKEEIKNLDKKLLEDKIGMMKTELAEQVKKGKNIEDVYIDGVGNLKDAILRMTGDLEKFNKDAGDKTEKTWKDVAGEIKDNIGSMLGSIFNIGKSFWEAQQEDLTKYDDAIAESYRKQEELLLAFDEKQKALNEENEAINVENLEKELERSIKANDLMSENAIRKKLNEIAADKKKKEEEKKLAKEREKIEKDTNREIAMAEYNKALAEHGNQVAMAETEKNKAIADAGMSVAQSVANAAMMPIMPGWAAMGPPGVAAGLAMAAVLVGGALGAIGGIKGATDNLDKVKASAPKQPAFAYGTKGFALGQGQSAIVGEESEVVKNKNGELEVTSVANTKNITNDNAANIILNFYGLTIPEAIEEIKDYFNNMKPRGAIYGA